MKKLIIVLLILGLMLVSCNTPTINEESAETQNMAEKQTSNETADESQKLENEKQHFLDIGGFAIYDYNEYLEFIASTKQDSDFVHYETISHLGEFQEFIVEDYFYLYGVKCANNAVIYYEVMFEDRRDSTMKAQTIDYSPIGDLRSIPVGGTGFIHMNGIQYRYVEGKINAIYWEENGNVYSIFGDIANYPTTGGSVMLTQLMNTATAIQGLASFKASINNTVTE